MGIFARAATKAFDQGLGTLGAGRHIYHIGGGRSVTGLTVTTDKALSYSPFWSAVRILSEDQAKLPLGVFEQMPNGSPRRAPEHPVERVIRYMANPQTNAFNWRETGMGHDLTWGNHYAVKARDGNGYVREVWPLTPERTEVERNSSGDLEYTFIRRNGSRETLSQRQVLHIPGLGWDGVKGYSLLRMARESLGLGLAAEEHGARFFGQGVTTNFVLSTTNKLSTESWDHLRAQVKEERAGLANAWEPWVLEEGLEPKTISMPHDDAQWLETRKHQVTEVSRWTRIPPHKLGDLERATFSNIEHQSLEYVTDSLMGWLTRWEMAIGMQLLEDDWIGLGGRFYVKFNVNALLRGDFKTRMDGYSTGMQWGFMTPDQIAELEEWPKIAGGDVYLRPLTHIAMSDLDANGMTFSDRVNAAGILVRAGYEASSVNAALGLPDIAHTGLVPITVQVDPSTVSPPSRNGSTPVGAT